MRSLFITVEGCDGAGKDTLIDGLVPELIAFTGRNVLRTREPGAQVESNICTDIRQMVLHRAKLVPITELLLYSADRAQHMAEMVIPALDAGSHVVCSRGIDSTFVYQGFLRKLEMEAIRQLITISTQGHMPDLTLWLDIDPELGMSRLTQVRDADKFERIEIQRQVAEGYAQLYRWFPQRIRRVPVLAGDTPQMVLGKAMAEIRTRLSA